jgi:glycosyltransferase involved in cell wall biosynthesis
MNVSLKNLQMVEPDFVYSVPEGTENSLTWGVAHYSWRVACNLFVSMLEGNGLHGKLIKYPHIYDHPIAKSYISQQEERPIHLIFRPFDQIRALKLGYNIGCIVWEFDRLTGDIEGQHPFSNQIRMLSCLDEIWTASEYSRSVFQASGITNIHLIPAPISSQSINPLSREAKLQLLSLVQSVPLNISHYRSNEQNIKITQNNIKPLYRQAALANLKNKKIFVSIINPGDYRKNIDSMLKGFAALYEKNKNNVLLLKCVVDNINTRIDNLQNDTIKPKIGNRTTIASDGIIILPSHFSSEEMAELYSLANFYLCTSRCEGQNLPLLEAMSYGAVPVSVNNTAMADYINEMNSFVIPSKAIKVTISNATKHFHTDLHWFEASEHDVFLTLERAAQASVDELELKRSVALQTVNEQFSPTIVFSKIVARFQALNREWRNYASKV